jgi:hypothetical protein
MPRPGGTPTIAEGLHREEAADGPPLCVFKLLLSLTATRDDMKGRAMRCGSEQREKSISMMEQ